MVKWKICEDLSVCVGMGEPILVADKLERKCTKILRGQDLGPTESTLCFKRKGMCKAVLSPLVVVGHACSSNKAISIM